MGMCHSDNEINALRHELDLQYKDIKVALSALEKVQGDVEKMKNDVTKHQESLDCFILTASQQGAATHEVEQSNQKSLNVVSKDIEDLRRGFHKILSDVDEAKLAQTGKPSKSGPGNSTVAV